MNPDLGIGIRRYLFEQSSSNIIQGLKPNITDQLNKYLPHVKLHSIDVLQEDGDIDNNSIKIKINCIIMNTTLVSLVAHLNRLAKLIIDYKKIKQKREINSSLVPALDTDLFSRELIL